MSSVFHKFFFRFPKTLIHSIIILHLLSQENLGASMPKIIAHRGASKEAPENTLTAFSTAIFLQPNALEIDVHLSKEGIPIVVHDGVFGRTTDGGFLQRTTELTLNEIKALDAGSWFDAHFLGENIPTLLEVLQLPRGAVDLMIEIKKDNSPAKEIATSVLAVLGKEKKGILLGSFDPFILQEILNQTTEYPVIGIVEEPHMLELFRKMGLKKLAIWYPLLDKQRIEQLHMEGIEVWTFTVDHPPFAQFLASIGVDGIITNDPRGIKRLLSKP